MTTTLKRKTFLYFAERYGINARAINSALDKLLERFIHHHSSLYLIEMTEKKKNLLERMITKRINDLK